MELIKKYLLEIRKRYNFDSAFYVSNNTLRYYHFKGVHKVLSRRDDHDVWYWDFIDQNQDYDLDVDNDQAAGDKLTIFINHRLNDYDESLLGVTGVGLSMDLVGKLLINYQQKYGRDVYLVAPDGLVQAHHDRTFINRVNIKDMEGLGALASDVLSRKSPKEILEFQRQGENVLLLVRYIPEFNWYLFVEQNEAKAIKNIRANLVNSLIIGASVTFVVILITILTVNYFQKKLEVMAVTDELTGVFNRREFEEYMDKTVCQKGSGPCSLIIVDIDRFKNINDTLGHLVGDQVIRNVAELTRSHIRPNDLLVRWGGDEFIILARSDVSTASDIAERIRKAVEDMEISVQESMLGPSKVKCTISCGVTEFEYGDDKELFVSRVDKALYEAKEKGRNRVIVA